jgi:hypothetical protein
VQVVDLGDKSKEILIKYFYFLLLIVFFSELSFS